MNAQPPSPGWSPPSQVWSPTIKNLPEGSVLRTWNLAPRLYSKNVDQVRTDMDDQPPLPGWSPIIQNLPEGCVLQTWKLARTSY